MCRAVGCLVLSPDQLPDACESESDEVVSRVVAASSMPLV